MRVDRIELQNYRCYREFDVSFRPGFNVIAGVNGSGKTSLLKGISEALACLTLYMPMRAGNVMPLHDRDAVRIQRDDFEGRYRFETQYPVKVTATGEAFGKSSKWSATKTSQPDSSQFGGQIPGQVWTSMQQSGDTAAQHTLPLIAFYPAYRQWPPSQPNEIAAASDPPSRTDGYQRWWDAASDSTGLQQWALGKSLERLQFASDRSIQWSAVDDDELALANLALSTVVEGVEGLRYDFSQKTLLIEWSSADPTPFRNLSDGQRVAVALVADIARRMCLLNPHLGLAVTKETPGVVLIDELDVHMHPKWQRLLTKGLSAAFPRVQFIAASHSPQVLGELQPEQILLLHADGWSHPQVSYGLDSSRVLDQIMEAKPRASEIEDIVSALFESLERNELADARNLLLKLKVSAPGIPELAGAEALLKRKEVIGR
ncbi:MULTISPECIES: AAA family ATPase [Paraburkholderia]|uniref:AAA family ATPase n=1 Tax=Paraburkholderia TaxID=1822464 RepID=UPI00225A823E|nr:MULTISPECIES: AAA family ATPase [Paraburkholderia]MCX4165325.1 AAA family ATPase [Paraburkholderia megapolitana]MDN7160817.1 AAA family ATPase [Paraburkholderia sp. CHISQ3]MDQ6497864.1 AAA family ATPase [Paraburkholderia megapolitana]